jgi:acyl-CoA thioesterase I
MADRRVLFFGDSHVVGVGDPEARGWVGRVVMESFRVGLPLTAYNLGVRGETSEHVAARWRTEASPRLVPAIDGRVVLSFGANDTTVEDGAIRVPQERSCAALAAILEEAANAGLPTLTVGPARVDDAAQNERIRLLSVAFEQVCDRFAVPFVDVVEPLLASSVWMSEVAAGDGAHPGAEGYQALAGVVLDGGWMGWLQRAHRPCVARPPGASVLVDELPNGDRRLTSTERVRERIRETGGRLVAEHGEALEILADHDSDAPQR